MERYSSYKNSGISWIGEIPEHWRKYIFKRLIKNRKAGSWGSEPKTSEIDCTCLRIADFDYDKFRFQRKTDNTIRSYKCKELEDRILKKGDILIEKSGGGEKTPVGRAILYDLNIKNAMYANFMEKIEPQESLTSEYLVYILSLMYSRRAIWTYVKYTTGIQNLDLTSLLSNEKIPLPPLAEQEKIVSYLEGKTSKIDAYVAEKEKEIQLLQELKQKTIADAVTKGLNPDVKMKDSGISWIGLIPEHWETKKIGSLFIERREKVSDKDYPALSVSKQGITPQLETAVKTDNGDNRKKVCKNDFVVNSRSDRKGSCGVSPYTGSVSLINIVLAPRENIEVQYYHHLFRSNDYIEEYYRIGRGIVADLWTTRYSEMRNIFVPLPPIDEQRAIVAYIEEKCQKIDTLVSELQAEIDYMKEYKQRLIADCVTGQVNVQNETI